MTSSSFQPPRPITRVLVANRGEIARRVFATCRRLGLGTVAVHSDADAGLPFVVEADTSVRLPGNTPGETYLRGDLLIAAARAAGADAIHPGYGFLSENADFAAAVVAADITWLGPSPEAIRSMGSKTGAKDIMRTAGVPVLEAPEDPTEADLPLLVKAAFGGGGRGMRVVRNLMDLPFEIERASGEAESAFGDGAVFVEPYVEAGRHVEVQVMGDVHGVVRVFGDRDCTVQRRHQKVVEEAPAPGLSEATRAAMHTAARQAAEALDYVGAGTVEFLYDPVGERFWFLEMNTRLQVEHPVTELVHGVDLVELQLEVAQGASLADLPEPRATGHAIEVRLYAEDDAWTPQSGRLALFEFGEDVAFDALAATRDPVGVRVDSGFGAGNEVGTHYDAMLAKVMAWAPTRAQATRRLSAALGKARIHGLVTNRDQLLAILADEMFADMRVTTTWLEKRPSVEETPGLRAIDATAAALMVAADAAARRTVQGRIPAAWRNVASQPQHVSLLDVARGDEVGVDYWGTRDGFQLVPAHLAQTTEIPETDVHALIPATPVVLRATPTEVCLETAGVASTWRGQVLHDPASGSREVWLEGPARATGWQVPPRFTDPASAVAEGSLVAPMPGSVISVAVAAGDPVSAGQTVLVMEAMKMQHTLTAPTDGVVTAVHVTAGQQVTSGDVLAVVEPLFT